MTRLGRALRDGLLGKARALFHGLGPKGEHPSRGDCPVCKRPLSDGGGIGPYCATKKCPVADDALLWNEDGTRIANWSVE